MNYKYLIVYNAGKIIKNIKDLIKQFANIYEFCDGCILFNAKKRCYPYKNVDS